MSTSRDGRRSKKKDSTSPSRSRSDSPQSKPTRKTMPPPPSASTGPPLSSGIPSHLPPPPTAEQLQSAVLRPVQPRPKPYNIETAQTLPIPGQYWWLRIVIISRVLHSSGGKIQRSHSSENVLINLIFIWLLASLIKFKRHLMEDLHTSTGTWKTCHFALGGGGGVLIEQGLHIFIKHWMGYRPCGDSYYMRTRTKVSRRKQWIRSPLTIFEGNKVAYLETWAWKNSKYLFLFYSQSLTDLSALVSEFLISKTLQFVGNVSIYFQITAILKRAKLNSYISVLNRTTFV